VFGAGGDIDGVVQFFPACEITQLWSFDSVVAHENEHVQFFVGTVWGATNGFYVAQDDTEDTLADSNWLDSVGCLTGNQANDIACWRRLSEAAAKVVQVQFCATNADLINLDFAAIGPNWSLYTSNNASGTDLDEACPP
jgi:hypothetical protein